MFGYADLYLLIHRATPIKLYVLIIIIALCTCFTLHAHEVPAHTSLPLAGLITLLLLAISIKAVFFRYHVDVAVLMVPVGTLFAFTSLRTSMPGSPTSFGTSGCAYQRPRSATLTAL